MIGLLRTKGFASLFKRKGVCIYYIDISHFSDKVIVPLLKIAGVEIHRLDFRMRDIKDDRGELVRIRITRRDLFEFQKKIKQSPAFKLLYDESWRQNRVEDYVIEGLMDGSIYEMESISRLLFVIEVIDGHMKYQNYADSFFIVRNRPWLDIFKECADKHGIKLVGISCLLIGLPERAFFYNILIKFPKLFGMLKNLKYGKSRSSAYAVEGGAPKIFLEGRGDVNLEHNGDHSDFFWLINSECSSKNTLYVHHSESEKNYLESHQIASTGEGIIQNKKYKCDLKKPRLNRGANYKDEFKVVESLLDFYSLHRYYWGTFFNAYNAKIYLTWNKYWNHHLLVADAIRENGGISAVWQMAFDGYINIECKVNADIYFGFSKFSHQIEKELGSSIKYGVITGYLKDYVPELKRQQAIDLRKKMQSKGAEKIVFVIDENSVDDERWHTGHGLQRENYSEILEEVLRTPWLGVVFKPKVAKTLRRRLGGVANLLETAEKTGRCHVYESSLRHTTSEPPILAGMSADVCIHTDLSSGTAALECAVEGLPTLLIDREGCPNSKFYELPEGKVIFKSWSETIVALKEHFKVPNGIPGFGDWSQIIDELDPFRDGKAAYRMGTYLHWMIQGFEKGMEREDIMADAAERYRKQWGADKVLSY